MFKINRNKDKNICFEEQMAIVSYRDVCKRKTSIVPQ